MRRRSLLALLALAAACSRRESPSPVTAVPASPVVSTAAPAPATALPAAPVAPVAPDPTVVAAQREMSAKVAAYTLTEETLDKIFLCEKDLASFWADPANARSIRGQLSLEAIYAAIERTPRVKKTLEAFHLAPSDYVLGTFAMMGGYAYEAIRRSDPNRVLGKAPPVTWPTLELIARRFDDVKAFVLPHPTPRPTAS